MFLIKVHFVHCLAPAFEQVNPDRKYRNNVAQCGQVVSENLEHHGVEVDTRLQPIFHAVSEWVVLIEMEVAQVDHDE